MKKILFALMLALASFTGTQAQITAPAVESHPETDSRYLMGAVPTVDGHAQITRTVTVNAGFDHAKVMEMLDQWLERCMKDDRVRFNQRLEQPSADMQHHSICMEITFSKSFFSHDYADLSYVLILDASQPGQVTMTMTRMAYRYNEGGKLTKYVAEELIADDIAINKKGKIIFGYKKFRIKTIDLMDELATSLQKELQ